MRRPRRREVRLEQVQDQRPDQFREPRGRPVRPDYRATGRGNGQDLQPPQYLEDLQPRQPRDERRDDRASHGQQSVREEPRSRYRQDQRGVPPVVDYSQPQIADDHKPDYGRADRRPRVRDPRDEFSGERPPELDSAQAARPPGQWTSDLRAGGRPEPPSEQQLDPAPNGSPNGGRDRSPLPADIAPVPVQEVDEDTEPTSPLPVILHRPASVPRPAEAETPRGPFEPARPARPTSITGSVVPPAAMPPAPQEPADSRPIPEGAAAKLEQIKDLYLTAEAIGEDALGKHFEQVSQRQRELIEDFFQQSDPAEDQ